MSQEKSTKVGLWEKVIYGSGDVGLNAMYTLFSSYVLYFYTDVIGMNAAIISTVIMFCKIFDGVSDIVAGQLIDRNKSKRGHCIPVLMKWSIPMFISVVLVFMVPNSSVAFRIAFILVTYNLFNTVMYTYVGLAHVTLASYATNDPVCRSQMMVYKMLFAAITQTIMANVILPMVNFFGGQTSQSAWIKATLVFGVAGVFFLYLNVFFVKERVENEAPSENMMEGLKTAFKNGYWIKATVLSFCTNVILTFNLSISVYYLNSVVGNMGLMGAYVTASNVPGIVLMIIMLTILGKVSKKKMYLLGVGIMILAQVIFVFSPVESVPMLIGTALLRGIGFALPMGLGSALIGDCIEYGEWKTGKRVQGVLFSATTLTGKIGAGLLTSVFGIFLSMIGYDGLKQVQDAGTISGINGYFRFAPFLFLGIMLWLIVTWKLDDEMPQIQKELAQRKGE